MVLLHPVAEGVLVDPDLFTDQLARGTHGQRWFVGQLLVDHAYGTVTDFCRVLTWCGHLPILSVRSSPPPHPGRSRWRLSVRARKCCSMVSVTNPCPRVLTKIGPVADGAVLIRSGQDKYV